MVRYGWKRVNAIGYFWPAIYMYMFEPHAKFIFTVNSSGILLQTCVLCTLHQSNSTSINGYTIVVDCDACTLDQGEYLIIVD